MNGARIAGGCGALLLAGVLVALEIWTLVPAPDSRTLPLAVAVPELAPWFVLVVLVALVLTQAIARGWARLVATFAEAFALGCALVPLVLLPSAIAAADRTLTGTLGVDYAEAAPDAVRARMQAEPFDLRYALSGLPASQHVRVALDLPFATRDGTRLGLDLYRPLAAGPHPAVVLVYGGAWMFGKRADLADLAGRLATIGYTVAVVDYRKAPDAHFPTQLEDVRDAIAALAAHAAAWNLDRAHVAICGFSAGGELALLAAYTPEPLQVRAAIGIYAATDVLRGYELPPRPDPIDVRRVLRAYLGGTPATRRDSYLAASPVSTLGPRLPPTLLMAGDRDELVRIAFQREMRDALRVHGDSVALVELPWSNHAFDAIPSGIGGQLTRYYVERFLAATL
jgi:acetyl esterase/lipase